VPITGKYYVRVIQYYLEYNKLQYKIKVNVSNPYFSTVKNVLNYFVKK
jgi:hypothetical protein